VIRSDALDQLLSGYLARPVRLGWEGALADSLTGTFRQASISFEGVATAWLPLERVVLAAEEARIVPGMPARLGVKGPSIEVVVGQRDVERWMKRFELPFSLHLERRGLLVKSSIAGFPLGEVETKIEVVRGWFVLRPRRAALLGVPQYVSSLFRTYLPVPPISDQTRLVDIGHESGRLRLRFSVDDFDEEITPGLFERLRSRVLPFAR